MEVAQRAQKQALKDMHTGECKTDVACTNPHFKQPCTPRLFLSLQEKALTGPYALSACDTVSSIKSKPALCADLSP